MDYCSTCVHYPPSSCDGKPCTQCDSESVYFNCYQKREETDGRTQPMQIQSSVTVGKWTSIKPTTNADRIRSMTDEELAEYLSGDEVYERMHWSMRHWLDWLKEEA